MSQERQAVRCGLFADAKARKNLAEQVIGAELTRDFPQRPLGQPQFLREQIEVFGGKIEYPRYGFLDRNMIRLIMWITGGPTDPRSVTDFTDWAQVEAFARRLVR